MQGGRRNLFQHSKNVACGREVAQLELWICWRASDVFFKTISWLHVGVMESSDDFGVCL